MKTDAEKIEAALDIAFSYAQTDGDHHKAWVIDQMCRQLLGEGYDAWVDNYSKNGEYDWYTGVIP